MINVMLLLGHMGRSIFFDIIDPGTHRKTAEWIRDSWMKVCMGLNGAHARNMHALSALRWEDSNATQQQQVNNRGDSKALKRACVLLGVKEGDSSHMHALMRCQPHTPPLSCTHTATCRWASGCAQSTLSPGCWAV